LSNHKIPKVMKVLDWWLSLSIRKKMMGFVIIVSTMVLIVTLFNIVMTNKYLADFNVILGDSYAVNTVQNDFDRLNTAFINYENDKNEELFEAEYLAQTQILKTDLDKLNNAYKQIGIQRYLLTQAIKTSCQSYMQRCGTLINTEDPKNTQYIKEYYKILSIGNYIKGYLKQLMQETLTQGNESYAKIANVFSILPVFAIGLGIFVVAVAFILNWITMNHIIKPLLALSRSSKAIADSGMDVPDIEVQNRDEIGELVNVFNKMKRSTAQLINTLHQNNELESQLHQEEIIRINTEKEFKEMQMSMLQSQINPHFLFNTLNTISRMAAVENAERTEELIHRLSNLFRYNLETDNKSVTLTRELDIINDYIYVQHERFGIRMGFSIYCCINTDVVKVPPFVLQPIVENSVIHGITPKTEGGQIRVSILGMDGKIVIKVVDNGRGISPEVLNVLTSENNEYVGHLSGIGLGNVKTRLKLMYPESEFVINSKVGLGTAVRITLPKKASQELSAR
jgi:two-component system LytT family sensor kinase